MIKDILERTSVRSFKKHKMTKKDMEIITNVINSAPTSTNSNQFSAILIVDDKIKKLISEANYGQKHIVEGSGVIVFVGDRYRIKNIADNKKIEKGNDNYMFHEYTRMVMDATIASAVAQSALIEMGYGVTYIGGLPTKGEQVEKVLNLPDNSFVVVGISFGKPKSNTKQTKIRMNKVFINKYNKIDSKKHLNEYNKITEKTFAKIYEKNYKEIIAKQISEGNLYYKHFTKGGKYLKKSLKNLK